MTAINDRTPSGMHGVKKLSIKPAWLRLTRPLMRKIILTSVAVFGLAVTMLLVWRSGGAYDQANVDVHLQKMRKPYQIVTLSCCMCGGMSFKVVDSSGITNRFAVGRDSASKSDPDGTLLWGARSIHDTNVTAVAMTIDSRRMLINLVENHILPGFNRDQGLVELRGDPRDYANAISHGITAKISRKFAK